MSKKEVDDSDKEVKVLKCYCTKEELKELELAVNALCPICNIMVGAHPCKESTELPRSTSTFNPFKGIKLPTFHKKRMVNVFLQSLEHCLIFNHVEEKFWPKSLMNVIPDSINSTEWIKKNIITTKLNWSDSKRIFIGHFQNADYELHLNYKWKNLRQGKEESIQEFVDRFNSLAEELNYADERIITDFLLNIHDKIHARYRDEVNADKRRALKAGTEYKEDTLKVVQDTCISFDVDRLTNSFQDFRVKSNPSRSTSSSSNGKKVCTNHPNTSSHSTNECFLTKRNNNSNDKPKQSPSPTKTTTTSTFIPTCYNCNESGHKSFECPKKLGAGKTTTTNTSNHQPIRQSPRLAELAAKSNGPTTRSNSNNKVNKLSVEEEEENDERGDEDFDLDVKGVVSITNDDILPILDSTTTSMLKGLVLMVNGQYGTTFIDSGCDRSLMDVNFAMDIRYTCYSWSRSF